MLSVITKKVFAYGGKEYETAGACLRAVIKDNSGAEDDAFVSAVGGAVEALNAAAGPAVKRCGRKASVASSPLTAPLPPVPEAPAPAGEAAGPAVKRRGRPPGKPVAKKAAKKAAAKKAPAKKAAAKKAAKRGRKSNAEKEAAAIPPLPPLPPPVYPNIPPLPPGA